MKKYSKAKIKEELVVVEKELKCVEGQLNPENEDFFMKIDPKISGVTLYSISNDLNRLNQDKRFLELELAVAELQEKNT